MSMILNVRYFLKIVGIIGWIIGLIAFLFSFMYMTEAVTFGTISALAETNFFGLLGVTFFISGTIVYMKSLEYKE